MMSKADNKELEEAIKILREIQECNRIWLKETKEENCEKMYLRDIEAIETVLKELKRLQEENSLQRWQLNSAFDNGFIHKDKIREKIIIDKSKLNNCTNSIFGNICKARIEFGQELLEGK